MLPGKRSSYKLILGPTRHKPHVKYYGVDNEALLNSKQAYVSLLGTLYLSQDRAGYIMDVTVNKITDETYEILFGENRVEVSAQDLEHLHFQLSFILRPETVAEKQSRHKEFLDQLVYANDSGIQSLLRVADHDDVVILLTICEEDEALKKKLYRNMTENAIKMFVEDMMFFMREGVPKYKFDEAMTRLIKSVEELTEKGSLVFTPQ